MLLKSPAASRAPARPSERPAPLHRLRQKARIFLSLLYRLYKHFAARTRKVALPLLHILVGILSTRIPLPFGLYPCGIALVCADRRHTLYSCIGSAVASLFLPAYGGVYCAAALLVGFLRAYYTRGHFDESTRRRTLLAALTGLTCGILGAFFSGGDPVFLLRCAACVIYLPLLTACFCRLREEKGILSRDFSIRDGILYACAALFTLAAARLPFSLRSTDPSSVSCYPALTVGTLFTLFASQSGKLHGLAIGLLCGVCSGSLPFAASLGIGGFIGGAIGCGRKRLMLPLFWLSTCAVTLVLFPLGAYDTSIATLVGTLLCIPLSEILAVSRKKRPHNSPHPCSDSCASRSATPAPISVSTRVSNITSDFRSPRNAAHDRPDNAHADNFLFSPHSFPRSLDSSTRRLSSTFSSVSELLFNVSSKLRYPAADEVREMVRTVCSEFCSTCPTPCEARGFCSYLDDSVEEAMVARLCGGGLTVDDLPKEFVDACDCGHVARTVEQLNAGYASLLNRNFNENKLEILASEYTAMARLLKHTANKAQADGTPDPTLTAAVTRALSAVGVRFSSACVYGRRQKIVDVYGVLLDGFPCTASEIAERLGKVCSIPLTEPEFIGVGKKATMRLRQARKLHIEYARAIGAKGENAVSGDSVSFFESDDERFYALISDGMGSGRSAALTSRLTALYVEKLLTCGTHKAVTLELLNDLLLSKSDESFATVDLLEVDLLSGEACFVKAGAAPAYILRAAKLYKIASCTPPAGIVRSFNAESTKFTLEDGDTVLMLSDGIVQSYDELPWLSDMLTAEAAQDPAKLANRILAKAKKTAVRDDDMTCAVLQVARRTPNGEYSHALRRT